MILVACCGCGEEYHVDVVDTNFDDVLFCKFCGSKSLILLKETENAWGGS